MDRPKSDVQIRLLTSSDAAALFRLRREALRDSPLSFAASPEDDSASSEDVVRDLLTRDPESVVFGAFADELIGMLGVYRAKPLKARHKAYFWGMFVLPEWRGRRSGKRLILAAIEHARALSDVTSVHLSVSESATAARRLYESVGFRVWGVEPVAIRWHESFVNDCHMVLHLMPDAPVP